jgi:hypothetical protein
MRKILLALALLICTALPGAAQGCGPQNPNCIVPTAPAGTCDNRAASTRYACNVAAAAVAPGVAQDLPIYNNAGTGLVDSNVPLAPAGGLNLYASPTGNDTNNTCMASGTPCTLKGACFARSQIATFISGTAKINLVDGTYNSPDGFNALCSILGNQGGSSSVLTTIVGDCGTPANVILAIPAGNIGLFAKDGGETSLQCATITGGNSSIGISAAQFSIIDLTTITWGAWGTGGRHISLGLGAVSNVNGETITANIAFHAVISGASTLNELGTITINPAVVWGNEFLSITNAVANFGSATFAGAGVAGTTGQRVVQTGGYLYTGGVAVDTFFPGNVASSLTQGAQDDNGDLQTAAYNLQAASVTNAKLVSNSSPSVGIGYAAGAGGTVTQATNKSTGVTLNTVTGNIVMNNATLNSGAAVGFTLTNSAVGANDVVLANIASGATVSSYQIFVDAVAATSVKFTLRNYSGSNLSEAVVINFTVIKGSAN